MLVRRPGWWAGVVGDGGGYLVQAALGFGSLLLVQPLLVTTLLFALPLGAAWAGRTLERTDWVWAVLLAVSLAVFVVAGNPTGGVDQALLRDWLSTGALSSGCSWSAWWPRPAAGGRRGPCGSPQPPPGARPARA